MKGSRLVTVRLEPEAHRRLKIRAAERETSMQKVVAEAIAAAIEREKPTEK